jgi:hypothetical protein
MCFMIVLMIAASGCMRLTRPVGETIVDRELSQPTPSVLPADTAQPETRPGFEQEPSQPSTTQ